MTGNDVQIKGLEHERLKRDNFKLKGEMENLKATNNELSRIIKNSPSNPGSVDFAVLQKR